MQGTLEEAFEEGKRLALQAAKKWCIGKPLLNKKYIIFLTDKYLEYQLFANYSSFPSLSFAYGSAKRT